MNGSNSIVASVQPDVHESMHKLDSLTSELIEISELLRERSSPVLRPKEPSEGAELGKKGYSTPLAAQIDRQGDNVDKALDIIKDIINRIQV